MDAPIAIDQKGQEVLTNHLCELPGDYWSLYTPLARQPIKIRGCLCKPAYVASEADLFDKWMINQQRAS